ncbi:hypothetical protein SuNHUV7_05820 (plasmid) [Pseudoseohaeicola sp. NH-UV-7]
MILSAPLPYAVYAIALNATHVARLRKPTRHTGASI